MTAIFQRRPANQTPPDERDRTIFKLAEIDRWTREKIASHIGRISRRRVSQIVQQVRLWLANHPVDDPALKTDLERKRLAQNLDRLRLEDVIERAVNTLNQAPPTLATTCSMEGGPVMRYVRDQPPVDVRLLKTYLRAVEALAKLNDRPEIPVPPPPPSPWLDPKIQNVIDFWNEKADQHHLKGEYMEMFAQQLGHAIVDTLGLEAHAEAEPDPVAAASSASQTSQREATSQPEPPADNDDPSRHQHETYDDPAADEIASGTAGHPSEKLEKGSAANPTAACKPLRQPQAGGSATTGEPSGATAGRPDISEPERCEIEQDIQGLDAIEKRLLTLLKDATGADPEQRDSLQQALDHVRNQKAVSVLRLSPHVSGAMPTVEGPSFNPQPEAQASRS